MSNGRIPTRCLDTLLLELARGGARDYRAPRGTSAIRADPWAAVACAPRARIPYSQAAIRRAKTEAIAESLRPVWSVRPSTVWQAKHGALKRL